MEIPENLAIPPQRKWPKYTDEQKDLIKDFLASCAVIAQDAEDACRKITIECGETERSVPNAEYWRNVVSAMKWAIIRVDYRQIQLAIREAIEAQQKEEFVCGNSSESKSGQGQSKELPAKRVKSTGTRSRGK